MINWLIDSLIEWYHQGNIKTHEHKIHKITSDYQIFNIFTWKFNFFLHGGAVLQVRI